MIILKNVKKINYQLNQNFKINNKNISNEDYKHAINVFETFKCNNLLDYSILYLKTDLCHLADVFQKFSNFTYETFELDCRHSFTLPGYSWECMLKMTKIELELTSDSGIYLSLMDTIRGGMTVCNKKFAKADNIYTRKKDENSDIDKYLMYLDANNLNGLSMSKPLPYKNFKWSNVIPSEISLNENKLKTGIYEVDFEIPENFHNKFKDFPVCPEIESIDENNLSDYQKYLNDKLNIKYKEKDKN